MYAPPVQEPAARPMAGSRRSIVGAVLAALLLAVAVPTPVVAADTTPTVTDPGPVGDFGWKGFNWEKRRWGGAPNYNKQFDPANVSSPDANGHVTLTLSNPTGKSTIGAEFNSTRHGFGYGTYSTTVEKDLSSLQKEVVWGCLFTYDASVAPGYNEIDLCEASSWGGGSINNQVWPITQGHGYWFDASKGPGIGNDTAIFGVTDHPILTHRLVWAPNKLTFETFAGEDHTGLLLKRTVLEGEKVPEPARETIHFNLWVTDGGGGDPDHVKPEKVVVRDFSFVPASPITAPAPAPVAPAPAPTAPVPVAPAPAPAPAPVPAPPTAAPTKPAPTKPAPTKPAVTKPAPTKPAPAPTKPAVTKPAPTKPAPAPTKPPATKPATKAAPPPSPAITLTSTSARIGGTVSTTLKWTGAKGASVTLLSNGVRRSVENTGRTTTTAKAASVRYRICDATRCSPVVLGGR